MGNSSKKGLPGFVWILAALGFMGFISIVTSAGDGLGSAASILLVGGFLSWIFFSD